MVFRSESARRERFLWGYLKVWEDVEAEFGFTLKGKIRTERADGDFFPRRMLDILLVRQEVIFEAEGTPSTP